MTQDQLRQKILETKEMITENNFKEDSRVTYVEKNIIESSASKNIQDIKNVFRIKKNKQK